MTSGGQSFGPSSAAPGPPPAVMAPPTRQRILFVDDEPKVLEGLQRMLYSLRNEWDFEFVSSAPQALERMAQTEFDVLVTDIRMPVMSGIELLSEVVDRYPHMVRLVLSGTVDQELTLRSAALAHQYLVKPCDANTLRAKVEHATKLRIMLDDPALKRVISRLQSLPSIPAVHVKLLEALRSPDASAKEIGEIVKQDIGMTAKVLQLVNSGLCGIKRRISTPAEAVVYLGVDAVRGLTLSASVFSQFRPKNLPGFSIEGLQNHSLKVANLAREIARSSGWPAAMVDDAYIGGMLHDAGKLVLAHNCTEQYGVALAQAESQSVPIREAERAVFGTSHAEVGGYLLWLWGISDSITEVACLHHRLADEPGHAPGPVIAVHIADAIVNRQVDRDLDQERLHALGWIKRLPEWEALYERLLAEAL